MNRTVILMLIVGFCLPGAFAQTIPDQIEAILARPALTENTWSVVVENADGTVRYYQKNPAVGKVPASNAKILTLAAACGLLGTDHGFETRIYLEGSLVQGTLTGNLNLVSEHDITWNESVLGKNGATNGLAHIVTKLKGLALTNVQGDVQCYGACYFQCDASTRVRNAPTAENYNAATAEALVDALRRQGISVSGKAAGKAGFSAPGRLFYTHRSSDLSSQGKPLDLAGACTFLMKTSHNAMADLLLRHVGFKLNGTDSFAGGWTPAASWLQDRAGLSTNGIVMKDAAGLASGNRLSANHLMKLMRYLNKTFPLWEETLPVGCVDGTLNARFCGQETKGRVHAKTGSLRGAAGAIALSGFIDNLHDRRRYFFSFLANAPVIDQEATRDAIDDCVALLGERGVPVGPQLLGVVRTKTGSLAVTWSDEKFVRTGYRLYGSADGVVFGPPLEIGPAVHTFTETNLQAGEKRYYRVAVSGSSGESPPSRTYGAQAGPERAQILIVDGNDRWQFEFSPSPGTPGHNFAGLGGQSIRGLPFDTAHHNAVVAGNIRLADYRAVLWMLGEESVPDKTFSKAEQQLLTAYLQAGGNLFVSGSETAWDLDRPEGAAAADRNFCHSRLQAAFGGPGGTASPGLALPLPGGIFSLPAEISPTERRDSLLPTNGSTAVLHYASLTNQVAAVCHDGTGGSGRVVHFGFPFEAIKDAAVRESYMTAILNFFSLRASP